MNNEELTREVDRLRSREEIKQVMSLYLDMADRVDQLGQANECFHEDALFVFQKGSDPVPARDFFTAAAENAELTGFFQSQHYWSNPMIRFINDDEAVAQFYLWAQHLVPADSPDSPPYFPTTGEDYGLVIGARYFDIFTRRNGQWKIAKRELYFEWDARIDPSLIRGPLASGRKLVPSEYLEYRPDGARTREHK